MYAPIVLFAYNRLDCLQQLILSLQKNSLSKESDLYIFVDGPKNDEDLQKIINVRNYLDTVDGFKSIKRFYNNENKGLAQSVIQGVTKIINEFGKVIVVEDDLLLSTNFLDYMNDCLDKYENDLNIFSISAYSLRIKLPLDYHVDSYFYGKPESWGWATWNNRWEQVDWCLNKWRLVLKNRNCVSRFNIYGSQISKLLRLCVRGKISSWYIRFACTQIMLNKLSIYPVLSKSINQGFLENATHCYQYNRFRVNFDTTHKNRFSYPSSMTVLKEVNRECYAYYSLKIRLISKLKTGLLRVGLLKQYIEKINM